VDAIRTFHAEDPRRATNPAPINEEGLVAVLLVIVDAIIPIAFVILLGVLAGRTGLISPRAATSLPSLR